MNSGSLKNLSRSREVQVITCIYDGMSYKSIPWPCQFWKLNLIHHVYIYLSVMTSLVWCYVFSVDRGNDNWLIKYEPATSTPKEDTEVQNYRKYTCICRVRMRLKFSIMQKIAPLCHKTYRKISCIIRTCV